MAQESKLGLEAGVPERMADLLGTCIPHYVRMFFENVYRAARLDEVRTISLAKVDEIYKRAYRGDMTSVPC